MPADDIQGQIVKYLTDVHSTEENALKQLQAGAEAVEDPRVAQILREHLAETEEHERLVRERLEALGESPSALKDMAQKGAAMLTGGMAGAAPDTTGKIAIQAYATEHLEIASYRSLLTVAERAGDQATAQMAQRILEQERAAAEKVSGVLEEAALVGLPQSATA